MKHAIMICITVLSLSSFKVHDDNTTFSWNKTTHDFGKIALNNPVTTEFEFQNQGEDPIVIVSAKGSCGCTVASFTKGEILPGDYGKISATYNAAKIGTFNKSVTVTTNMGDPVTLQIKGEVIQ
ncbi:DUF1573 domain-containing protein [Reichenbachiella agarivorans]|uniref:DUF1573 domain-containing protein n=1 Tax=Reichenbachiella agarivorans TaxID=2979464 RepID=A0ABY6CRF2_9BACT|nr:DUF1573 domain-containing protein [Reichenbachiella agarivorans]UXP33076.1 DUF1573 domain-containing protein [Reichenbachiella agarivorans]